MSTESAAGRFRLEVLRLARRIRQDNAPAAVSDIQLDIVSQLHDGGPETPGRLAEIENVTPQAINRTVNHLETEGHVRRSSDPEDGRRVLIEVTESGRALVEETRRRRNAAMRAEFTALSAADRAVLVRATELIAGMLRG